MNITKEILSEIDHIEIALENCDGYSIKPEDIHDIWFDEIEMEVGREKYNRAHNGRLVLSKNMFKQLGDDASVKLDDGTTLLDHYPKEDFYFYNRITSWCDITQVHVFFKNGKKLWFFVKYNPVESELTGCTIEYSNCASAELDENGDMLILFGDLSHAYARVDNDYYNVIEGLDKLLPQKIKGELSVKVEIIGNGGGECWNPENGLYIEMRIQNKEYKNKRLPLQFFDVSETVFYFDFNRSYEENLYIAPMSNGLLFVELGETFCFYCKSIKVLE